MRVVEQPLEGGTEIRMTLGGMPKRDENLFQRFGLVHDAHAGDCRHSSQP